APLSLRCAHEPRTEVWARRAGRSCPGAAASPRTAPHGTARLAPLGMVLPVAAVQYRLAHDQLAIPGWSGRRDLLSARRLRPASSLLGRRGQTLEHRKEP